MQHERPEPLRRYKVCFLPFWKGRVPLDLRFRGPLEAKSFIRGPNIDPPGAPGGVLNAHPVVMSTAELLHGMQIGSTLLRNNASGPEIGLPGQIWPDCYREHTEIGPQSGQHLAGKTDFRPGSTIA